MKKNALLLLLLLIFVFPRPAHAGYWQNLARDWSRGIKNIVSFPLEIPRAIQEHNAGAGYPVVRYAAGFSDGLVRGVERLGSGLWDIVPASLMPGIQEGFPADPETLF